MKDFYFTIFNSTWTVSFVDAVKTDDEKDFVFGITCGPQNRIEVATKDSAGNKLPETTVRLTVLHEMIHAILDEGQYNDASLDEPMIEWLANCIYSLKQQNKL